MWHIAELSQLSISSLDTLDNQCLYALSTASELNSPLIAENKSFAIAWSLSTWTRLLT